jgi:hypothetical protein
MPARIELTPEALIVHMEGADRLWALKSRLAIPIEHVVGAASATEETRKWLHGMRVGGTHIPGVISAGRFYSHGQLVFWDVHDPEKAIALELADERYGGLLLEVEDPEAEIARIEQAIAGVPA